MAHSFDEEGLCFLLPKNDREKIDDEDEDLGDAEKGEKADRRKEDMGGGAGRGICISGTLRRSKRLLLGDVGDEGVFG